MLDLPEVSDCVAKLCCAWWERKAAGREALVSQTTPYVLVGNMAGRVQAAKGAGTAIDGSGQDGGRSWSLADAAPSCHAG